MEEAEEMYEAEADYFEEEEEEEEELNREEEEEVNKEEEPEIDYEAEIEEKVNEYQVIQKINELDSNHRTIRVIAKHKRKSSHRMQYTEVVEAIGCRISQIENGSPVFTDVTGYTNATDMAKKEFIDRKSPFILVREMYSDNSEVWVEEWKVRKMTFPVSEREILNVTNPEL